MPDGRRRTAYRARWLIDGQSDDTLEGGVVIVEGRSVIAYGSSLPIPDDCSVVDLGSSTILPGLIDCHVHLPFDGSVDPVDRLSRWSVPQATIMALAHAQEALAAGITTVRDVSSPHRIAIALRETIAAGHVLGPRIVSAGTHLCMTGGHGSVFGVEVTGAVEMRRAVREQLRSGADFIKLMGTGGVYSMGLRESPDQIQLLEDEMRAAVDLAHGLGLKVASHSEGEAGIAVALDAGVDTIEHGNHLTPQLAQQMLRQGSVLVPTVGAFRNNIGSTELDPGYVEVSVALAKATESALRTARTHGVKVACGTDRGTAMNMPWSKPYFADEVRYLIELGGFSPMAAVQSATIRGAEALGVDQMTGSIAPGKRADLCVVRGNVLEDIRALEAPTLVLKEGLAIRPSQWKRRGSWPEPEAGSQRDILDGVQAGANSVAGAAGRQSQEWTNPQQ